MKREKMEYRLKKELDAARYAHTLGVEQTAREMARQFGEDEEKAALAGLLHDCAQMFATQPDGESGEGRKARSGDEGIQSAYARCGRYAPRAGRL